MSQERLLPMTAGALVVNQQIHAHTSVRGDQPPRVHPLLAGFLAELPTSRRERFAGWCAEAVLVSDQLYAAEEEARAERRPLPLTVMDARVALWGAKIRVCRVREADDPTHGTTQPPCRSCADLLDWLGVEVMAE